MIQFDPASGLDNSFNATHYDPRIDGSLRFKIYLRTNVNSEIVTNFDLNATGTKFTTATLASTVNNLGQFQT